MAVAAQASLGAGSQPPTGGNQPREGSIVVTGQQAKDQKAPPSSQVEKVGGVKAKAADSQTKDNSGSGQAQGHDRSEDWQAQQDREAEEREQTERHYAYNAGWLDPAADSQTPDTATRANRSERPTNDPSSADTRDNTHSTKQRPDQGRQTKDTDAHAPRTPERRSNLHKTTNGTDKRGKDGRSPTKRRWPPGQTSAQGNARARAKHTQTTKSQDHPHPSDSATQQNRKPDTDAEGYQTQATSSDNGQAQTTSPDSWGAWGDSGTGDGSSGYWEESSVRSEEDMVRFTPVKGTAETTEGVPDDGTSGATDETSDGTHTNYPVMTHHAAHKCKSCTSGKWKLVNAPPILKRQVRQVIGAKGSGIKPMISELTETKQSGPPKFRKGTRAQTTSFVNQMVKVVECEGEAFAHVHVLAGTPKHETEVVERHVSKRLAEVQGYRSRVRDSQIEVAMAYDRRETDRIKFEERAEEILAKGSNEIAKMASSITKHKYVRREAANYTAIQQFVESEKRRPATEERERNVKQAMLQARNLQAAGAKSPQRRSTIVRGIIATPVTYVTDRFKGKTYGRHYATHPNLDGPIPAQQLHQPVRLAGQKNVGAYIDQSNAHPSILVMAIDRDRLPEFPLLTRQATNPYYLILQILERVNSFTQKAADQMTPQECKRFITSL